MWIVDPVSDIFLLPNGPLDAVCVTTNGIIKKDGRAVMGKGIALEADRRFGLAEDLAALLRQGGNQVYCLGARTDAASGRCMTVYSFPTKHHWKDNSNTALIERSAKQLMMQCNALNIRTCYLPRPGCANGGLDWETQVKPTLEPILDDRFFIADRRPK